jgi:membrane protease YdiL (CAAX protease family)
MSLAPGQTPYDLLLIVFAALLMPVLSTLNGRRLARDPDAPLVPRYWRTLARGWLAVAALALLWHGTGRSAALLGLDIPVSAWGRDGLGVVAVVCVAYIVIFFNVERLVSPARYELLRAQMRRIKILPRTTGELIVFLAVAVTAGIWEELIYRGFLIWAFAPYATLAGAVVLSSAVFGLGHIYQGPRGVLTTAVLGFVFALGFVTTRSLWWVMAAHALVDLYGGTLAWRVLRMRPADGATA